MAEPAVSGAGAEALDAAWSAVLEPGREDERVVAVSGGKPRAAEPVPLPADLAPPLRGALEGVGITALYSHQAAAWERAAEGDVIVTSGTASGKSLSFNLPVLNAIATDDHARALYLYPTKALAQDQARKLGELRLSGLRHAIYDGDTPREDRPQIR